jgi:hypothetical protein
MGTLATAHVTDAVRQTDVHTTPDVDAGYVVGNLGQHRFQVQRRAEIEPVQPRCAGQPQSACRTIRPVEAVPPERETFYPQSDNLGRHHFPPRPQTCCSNQPPGTAAILVMAVAVAVALAARHPSVAGAFPAANQYACAGSYSRMTTRAWYVSQDRYRSAIHSSAVS